MQFRISHLFYGEDLGFTVFAQTTFSELRCSLGFPYLTCILGGGFFFIGFLSILLGRGVGLQLELDYIL